MATVSKQKKFKSVRQKLKLFRSNEPLKSVLMWGINYSSSAINHVRPRATLLKDDYKAHMKVKVNNFQFNKENMPSHYKFKEYCPMVFKNLRDRFGVHKVDYLESFTKHQPIWDSGRGKSGSKFLVTYNRQFVAKTISTEEVEQMNQLLEDYYAYIAYCNGQTLLPQYLGLYRISVNDQETYILVMRNVFSPRLTIHKMYDLKGTTIDRESNEKEKSKSLPPLKDSDFMSDVCKIYLGEAVKPKFIGVLESDIQFLQENNLTDYSLIIGLHEFVNSVSTLTETDGGYHPSQAAVLASRRSVDHAPDSVIDGQYQLLQSPTTTSDEERAASAGDGQGNTVCHLMCRRPPALSVADQGDDDATEDEAVDEWETLVCDGFVIGDGNLTTTNPTSRNGSPDGIVVPTVELYPYLEYYGINSSTDSPRQLVYFISIGDILNRYGSRKRTHRGHGSGQDGGSTKPEVYGRRLLEFISHCIV